MKIAILSDIHGNSFALNETLKKVKQNKINKIFVLGDMIGYYYGTDILKQLNKFDCIFIAGNHEVMLKDVINNKKKIEDISKKYGKGIEYTLNKCSTEEINFFCNLKISEIIEIDNLNIGLFHGSPFKNDEYIYPDADISKLNSLNNNNYDFIFLGHTHRPFIYNYNNCSIVNVGSVGQNRVEGGISSWVILNTENNTIQFMSTKYDINKIINSLENSEPEYLKNILYR
tara:strand:+ start:16778 stop:17464 length:687 start_codon:yes stop_codon:yes gene_type:complete